METERKKWYKPATRHTGWTKADPPGVRRRKALKAHDSDKLATARSLQALSNISQDEATKRKAREDAKYFYRMHKSQG
jgi:hypothetical protein